MILQIRCLILSLPWALCHAEYLCSHLYPSLKITFPQGCRGAVGYTIYNIYNISVKHVFLRGCMSVRVSVCMSGLCVCNSGGGLGGRGGKGWSSNGIKISTYQSLNQVRFFWVCLYVYECVYVLWFVWVYY